MPSPPPWATGPAEILEHGLQLLDEDTDAARRLAMISIDNAVELTIRTYLGLPRQITGLTITRRKFAEISESFPDMLDALEEHASDLIGELNLGEIEWFHRVRNQLYHDGNGLTVDRRHVAVYAVIARVVWETLLGGPGDDDLSGKKCSASALRLRILSRQSRAPDQGTAGGAQTSEEDRDDAESISAHKTKYGPDGDSVYIPYQRRHFGWSLR